MIDIEIKIEIKKEWERFMKSTRGYIHTPQIVHMDNCYKKLYNPEWFGKGYTEINDINNFNNFVSNFCVFMQDFSKINRDRRIDITCLILGHCHRVHRLNILSALNKRFPKDISNLILSLNDRNPERRNVFKEP